jgi:hypothetical protein
MGGQRSTDVGRPMATHAQLRVVFANYRQCRRRHGSVDTLNRLQVRIAGCRRRLSGSGGDDFVRACIIVRGCDRGRTAHREPWEPHIGVASTTNFAGRQQATAGLPTKKQAVAGRKWAAPSILRFRSSSMPVRLRKPAHHRSIRFPADKSLTNHHFPARHILPL